MPRMTWRAAVHAAVALATVSAWAPTARSDDALHLTLPAESYAVVGRETNIYYDNVVLLETRDRYRFEVAPATLGKREPRRWTFTPTPEQVGTHTLTVRVGDSGGTKLAERSMRLVVVPDRAWKGRELKLLIVGDSLTHATMYPNSLAQFLSEPDGPKWTMLGTHRPASAKPGVAHEGYGGWTWEAFVSRYAPQPDPAKRIRSSPFVFVGDDGRPALDVPRYFREHCDGRKPDVVTFLLGINDCFAAKADDPAALDARIDQVFKQADLLLAAFHRAAPQADLAVCLTTPPNDRPEAFVANYKDRYPRAGWKRIQHRLVERELEHFAGRTKDGVFIVPTELNLDPVDGYPVDNAVHPNAVGYRQIADSIYAWLQWRGTNDARR